MLDRSAKCFLGTAGIHQQKFKICMVLITMNLKRQNLPSRGKRYNPVYYDGQLAVAPLDKPCARLFLTAQIDVPTVKNQPFCKLKKMPIFFGCNHLRQVNNACKGVSDQQRKTMGWFLPKWLAALDLQLLIKLSQCLATLERLTWNKSNKLYNNLKIIYVIVQHLSFQKCPEACDLYQN
jgi:hypothetical protein